jgi:hypothetical protein
VPLVAGIAFPVSGRRMAWASSVAMSLTVGLPATWESARKEPSGATTIPR